MIKARETDIQCHLGLLSAYVDACDHCGIKITYEGFNIFKQNPLMRYFATRTMQPPMVTEGLRLNA